MNSSPKTISDAVDFRQLHAAYKEAEDAIHVLGIDENGVDVPAINELRYAGRHILNGLVAESDAEREDQFLRAKRHCQRALYDAYDGAIYYRLRWFQEFEHDYRLVSVSKVVPEFVPIKAKVTAAKKFLDDARTQHTARDSYYEEARGVYDALKSDLALLDAARGELNKEIENYNRDIENAERSRMEAERARVEVETARTMALRNWQTTAIIGVITIVIGVVALVLASS